MKNKIVKSSRRRIFMLSNYLLFYVKNKTVKTIYMNADKCEIFVTGTFI